MATTFTFLTFEEWVVANPDISDDEESECPHCDGEGEHECECGDTHPCGNCDGTGKTGDGATQKEKYKIQKAIDEARLDKWLKKNA